MGEKEMSEVKELKPGERAPEGKDGPRVQYAAGKIAELLLGLHEKDRPHVIEGLNKLGVLSGGISKLEKDQERAQKDAVEASAKWVEQVKKETEPVALRPKDDKHDKKEGKK
jgi:hypothetical protein